MNHDPYEFSFLRKILLFFMLIIIAIDYVITQLTVFDLHIRHHHSIYLYHRHSIYFTNYPDNHD